MRMFIANSPIVSCTAGMALSVCGHRNRIAGEIPPPRCDGEGIDGSGGIGGPLLFLVTNGLETLTNEGQMNLTSSRIATVALLVAGASSAYAGQPVATLACSGGTSLSVNLSHFDLGVSDSTSGGSTGGTAVLMPLTLHASLGSFGTLFQAQASGSAIPSGTRSM
jgi:hypothetical protein